MVTYYGKGCLKSNLALYGHISLLRSKFALGIGIGNPIILKTIALRIVVKLHLQDLRDMLGLEGNTLV
jgi:hypothetical protein